MTPDRRALLARLAVAALVFPLGGCGSDPDPVVYNVDTGIECVPGGLDAAMRECPSGQLCLTGRCYDRCSAGTGCARGETCNRVGACIPRPGDAGTDDPCRTVLCPAPQVCHPQSGTCVQCLRAADCPGGNACNIATGRCEVASATACAPCNSDAHCVAGAVIPDGGTPALSCVARMPRVNEQVCLPTHACVADAGMLDGGVGCPPGLRCTSGSCLPIFSCTGVLSARAAKPCAANADCEPLGSDGAPGQCGGLAPDAGVLMGTCRLPCSFSSECPVVVPGIAPVCDADQFCA